MSQRRPTNFDELERESLRYAKSRGFPEDHKKALAQAYRDGYRTALGDIQCNIAPAFRRISQKWR